MKIKSHKNHFPFFVVLAILFCEITECWVVTFVDSVTTRSIGLHGHSYQLKDLANLPFTPIWSIGTDIRIDVFLRKYQGLVIFYVVGKVFAFRID